MKSQKSSSTKYICKHGCPSSDLSQNHLSFPSHPCAILHTCNKQKGFEGAAAQAGLRLGDVIVRIENKKVNDVSSLSDALVSKKPGDTISVHVYRGNQQLTVNAKLGEIQIR